MIMRLFSFKKVKFLELQDELITQQVRQTLFFLQAHALCKILMRFYLVNIVKKWHLLLHIFYPIKNQE